MNKIKLYSILQTILAAILFGASAPLAKIFTGDIHPALLAAFLYLGSGIGLFFFRTFRYFRSNHEWIEAGLKKRDAW